MEKLGERIPSLNMKFVDSDIFGEDGWMYIDRNEMPLPIPEGYLEGISVVREGKEFKTVGVSENQRRREAREVPVGRFLTISYTSFWANQHLYGTVSVYGVELTCEDKENHTVITRMSPTLEECARNPMLSNARWRWNVKIGRILPEKESNDFPGLWGGYFPGDRTQRFNNVPELVATGAYFALKYIAGPFFLTSGDTSVYDEKSLLMTVDRNGVVTMTPLLLSIIQRNENHV